MSRTKPFSKHKNVFNEKEFNIFTVFKSASLLASLKIQKEEVNYYSLKDSTIVNLRHWKILWIQLNGITPFIEQINDYKFDKNECHKDEYVYV